MSLTRIGKDVCIFDWTLHLKKARSYAIMKHPGKLRIKVSVNLVIKRPEPAEIKTWLKTAGIQPVFVCQKISILSVWLSVHARVVTGTNWDDLLYLQLP